MSTGLMADVTKVSRVSEKTPTLRTSIPIDLAKELGIRSEDSIIWTKVEHGGRKGLFVRKVE